MADRLRQEFPQTGITETRSKVLLKAMEQTEEQFFQVMALHMPALRNMDVIAVIGAVAARECFSGQWTTNLSLTRDYLEQDPKTYWLAPLNYFRPE